MTTLRMMPRPISFLILKALYKGFQMRYHLFLTIFGKVVKIKQTSFLLRKRLVSIAHHCKIMYSCYRQRLIELCQKKSKEHNGWIFTWGYHFLFHGDMNRGIIDQICPDQPLVVWHRSFHCLHLNSKGTIH